MDNLTEQERVDRYKDVETEEEEDKKPVRKTKPKNDTNMFHWVFYLIATGFMGLGFYKILYYDSNNLVNSYVGGDAYNYIINACLATAYFVLSLIFFVQGNFINYKNNLS